MPFDRPLNLTAADVAVLDAARTGVAIFALDDRALYAVTGRHRTRFLHAMLTCDVKGLRPGQWHLGSLCRAEGKLLGDVIVRLEAERLILEVPTMHAPAMLEALRRYIVADDVDFEELPDRTLVALVGEAALATADAAGLLATQPDLGAFAPLGGAWEGQGALFMPRRTALPEVDLDVPTDALETLVPALVAAGATPGCFAAFEVLRVEACQPRYGVDVGESELPLEAGLSEAVSFTKGCYIGQEAIAMMAHRGKIRRQLTRLRVEEGAVPAPGWLLTSTEGRRAGRVGSVVRFPDGHAIALGVVSRSELEPGTALRARPAPVEGLVELVETPTAHVTVLGP